jgi:predicted PurR-regulated permease PerM
MRWFALLAVTALILYLCWLMLEPFVDVLMWAVVLVVTFFPLHRRILRRTGAPNTTAAISCVLVVVTIVVPLALVTVLVLRDVRELAKYVQENRESLLQPNEHTFVGRTLQRIDRFVDIDRYTSREYLAERSRALAGAIASRTLNAVGGVVGIIVQVFFMIFTMFYFFRDAERIRAAARSYLPLDAWTTHEIFQRTREVIYASIYGMLVIALVQGALGLMMFWILGVPSALLWATVMILASFVPVIGTALVWVPAVIYLLITGHWVKAIILVVWCVGVIGTVDNFLRPKLIGQRTRLHELVVLFAVLGGIQVFGALGIVTGPAIAAIALALLDVWRQPGVAGAGAGAGAGGAAAFAPPTAEPASASTDVST